MRSRVWFIRSFRNILQLCIDQMSGHVRGHDAGSNADSARRAVQPRHVPRDMTALPAFRDRIRLIPTSGLLAVGGGGTSSVSHPTSTQPIQGFPSLPPATQLSFNNRTTTASVSYPWIYRPLHSSPSTSKSLPSHNRRRCRREFNKAAGLEVLGLRSSSLSYLVGLHELLCYYWIVLMICRRVGSRQIVVGA